MTVLRRYISAFCVGFFCLGCFFQSHGISRPVLGILPFQFDYPIKQFDWAGVFLQEELTHQLILSQKISMRSAEVMQLWHKQLDLATVSSIDTLLLSRMSLHQLLRANLQKVLQHASIEGNIFYTDNNLTIQHTHFKGKLSWNTPDLAIFDLITILSRSVPHLKNIAPYPQNYTWESLSAFYSWKLQPHKQFGTKEWQQYKEELEALLSHYPEIARLIYPELAALLLFEWTQKQTNKSLLQQAELSTKEALRLDPQNDKNHALLAHIYYLQEDTVSSKTESVIAHAHNSQNSIAKILYGLTIGENTDERKKHVLKGLEDNPFLKNYPTFANRNFFSYAALLPILPKWSDQPVVTNTVPEAPIDTPYQSSLKAGQKYFQQQQWKHAQENFKIAHSQNPEELQPKLYLARILLAQKKYDHALKSLTPLAKQFPKNEQVLLYMGLTHEHQKSYQQATQYYRKALVLNQVHPLALLRLGTVLIKLKQYKEAQNYLETLTRKFPKYAIAWWNLGLLHWQQNDSENAHIMIKEALRLEPNNPKFRKFLERLEKNTKSQSNSSALK
ncbi:MAG: tetratricopeptide repeat protein [SAR324 cluster bacterium]|nr:tetratricopeptide repeat protein [SAR324 cluster bacterium]